VAAQAAPIIKLRSSQTPARPPGRLPLGKVEIAGMILLVPLVGLLVWLLVGNRSTDPGHVEKAPPRKNEEPTPTISREEKERLQFLADLEKAGVKPDPFINTLGMKLTPIPPGMFFMGSADNDLGHEKQEGPRHEVVLTRPFYLGVHEVTVGQFRAFVKDKGYQTDTERKGGANRVFPDGFLKFDAKASWQNPGFEQTDQHPVLCVSWNDAVAFCEWLSAQEGKRYRLPTEAEWETPAAPGRTRDLAMEMRRKSCPGTPGTWSTRR
jgi:formylglycine-generating enzyme required for sulfatase activity